MSKKKRQEFQQNELVDLIGRKYGEWRPYMPVILSVVGVVVAVIIGGVWYFQQQKRNPEKRWEAFSDALDSAYSTRGGNPDTLTAFAEAYPGTESAHWANFIAAHFLLEQGSTALINLANNTATEADKGTAEKRFEEAKSILQEIVDSNDDIDKMLMRRAMYLLAYAQEGLGEFDDAQKIYEQLVDEGKESPVYRTALRAVKRVSRSEVRDFYKLYTSWEPVTGSAPGKLLPRVPNISFPEPPTVAPGPGAPFELPDLDDGKAKSDAKGKQPGKDGDSNSPPVVPKVGDDKKDDQKSADSSKSGKADDKAGKTKDKADKAGSKTGGDQKKSDDKKSDGGKSADDKKSDLP